MKLNENYSFALGLNNDIVALSGFSSQMQYGYLTEVTEPENKADDEVKFEVYTLGGVLKTLSVKRAKVDGVSSRKKADILPVLNANVSKLIKFKLGKDGTVSVIDTAETVYEYKEPSDIENCLMQYKFTSGGKEVTEFTYRSAVSRVCRISTSARRLFSVFPRTMTKRILRFLTNRACIRVQI